MVFSQFLRRQETNLIKNLIICIFLNFVFFGCSSPTPPKPTAKIAKIIASKKPETQIQTSENDNKPADEQTQIADAGDKSPDYSSVPPFPFPYPYPQQVIAGDKPADEQIQPVDEQTQPADDDKKPADEQTQPADDDKKPADEQTQPADEQTQPADASKLDPVKSSIWNIYVGKSIVGMATAIGPNHLVANIYSIFFMEYEEVTQNIFLKNIDYSSTWKIKKIVSVSHDLALLETTEKLPNYLTIRTEPPKPDEKLHTIDYVGGLLKKVNKSGEIIDRGVYYDFPLDHITSGVRGNPILDEQNQIVGLVSLKMSNLLSAIKAIHLKNLTEGKVDLNCSRLEPPECIMRLREHLEKSANEQGNISSVYKIGYMNLISMRLNSQKQADDTLFRWVIETLRTAAKYGHVMAQYTVASLAGEKGVSLQEDKPAEASVWFQESVYWYREAAKQNLPIAEYNLGIMLSKGVGAEKNMKLAFSALEKAAKKGVTGAQHTIATWLRSGEEGIEKDIPKAIYWYEEAVKHNFIPALYDLAIMFYSGTDTKQDHTRAFELHGKAAGMGFTPAQFSLASMYANGEGTERDMRQAHFWMNMAALMGHPPAIKFLEKISNNKATK